MYEIIAFYVLLYRQCYLMCSGFHPNRFTFGGVIAERVNTAKLPHKVNPTFGRTLLGFELNNEYCGEILAPFSDQGNVWAQALRFIGREGGGGIAQHRRSLISTIALFISVLPRGPSSWLNSGQLSRGAFVTKVCRRRGLVVDRRVVADETDRFRPRRFLPGRRRAARRLSDSRVNRERDD